ncbi:hypothetical protein [Streptomyces aureocirculatus]|uniref:hypothetical protein n=1 Tax=Streptomyces aureocirculatus TaxID=67275 RepID=UPI0004CB9340|nr:hypothetical protein [Streptomyces aureocirculatus]
MALFTHRNAGGRCPCGAENAACGPSSDVVPVDQRIEEVAAVSGPLKKYKVRRGDFTTVMKLSDEDAERLGVGPADVVGAASTIQPVTAPDEGQAHAPDGRREGTAEGAPADEAAAATAGESEREAPAKRRAGSANKARTSASTKAADGGN